MTYNEVLDTPKELLDFLEMRVEDGAYQSERGIWLHTGVQSEHFQLVLAERTNIPNGQWTWVFYDRESPQMPTKVTVGTSLEDLLATLRSPTPGNWLTLAEAGEAYFKALSSNAS